MRTSTIPWVAPVLLASLAWAQPGPETGYPLFRHYSPRVYGAQGQTWAALQDRRGILLVGNNDGILEYDGVHWRILASETELTVVRALAMDLAGRIYVGARGNFGYLEPDAAGLLRFTSLVPRLKPEERKFQDVWSVVIAGEDVFFAAAERVFRLSVSGELEALRVPDRLLRAAAIGGELYAQISGRGLMRWQRGGWSLVPGGERFAGGRIGCLLEEPGGSLLVAAREAVFRRRGDQFVPLASPAAELLASAQVYSCSRTSFGFALATLRNGVLLLDHQLRLLGVVNMAAGLPTNLVSSVTEDQEGGLWLTGDLGVIRLEAPAALTVFDARAGLKGTVLQVARHEDRIYAGTVHGLYRLQPGTGGAPARFELVDPVTEQVFALLSTEAGLLIGGSNGVAVWRGGRAERLAAVRNVYDLVRLRRDPNTAFALGPEGLFRLEQKAGRWQAVGRVPGIQQLLRRAAEDRDGRLWLGSDFQGVLRLDLRQNPPAVETFGTDAGLPEAWSYPFPVAGGVAFSTAKGPLRFDETARKFTPAISGAFAAMSEAPLLMHEDPAGNVWAAARSYSGVLRRQPDGSYRWDPSPFRRTAVEALPWPGQSEIYGWLAEPSGVVWAASAEGIVRYDPTVPLPQASFQASIRRVQSITAGAEEVYFHGASPEFGEISLPYRRNSLRFEVAASSFAEESQNEFRFQLVGFDPQPSGWTRETRRDYTNLSEGEYRFRVEARNLYGIPARPAEFAFHIEPPWYRAWWAYLIYAAVFGLAMRETLRWRLRAVEEHNRRLQQLVDQRTEEIRLKSEELERANAALTQTNAELETFNREKNEFMGIAAHDLKNPLGAIRGYAEMIEEDAGELPPDEIAAYAGKIKSSANLMFDLVSNLLDVNRIERGQMQATLSPCDVWECAARSAENFRARAEAKRIELLLDGGRPAPARADAGQLAQVLDNLISNAIKYSPPGKRVFVRSWEQDGRVRVEVRDEGPGLTPEDHQRLFTTFARLSAKPTAGEHSTGLGLAIVKRLVEQMQGRVWCESQAGRGAAFIIELPRAEGPA